MPLTAPNSSPKRQLARKLFDAVISGIPVVGGPWAAMLSVTHPSKIEQLQSQWQADVAGALNQMEKIVGELFPTIPLSDLAAAVGVWISATSKLGRGDLVEFDALRVEFDGSTADEIEDALGELEFVGLLESQSAIGRRIVLVIPISTLYEVFDPVAFDGVNPRADAACASRLILSLRGTVSAEAIMSEFGWSIRRYNPAIRIVCGMIGDGRRSAEVHPTISCGYVMPDSSERAALRHFADRVLGPRHLLPSN